MNKIPYASVPSEIKSLLYRIDIRDRHVEDAFHDKEKSLFKIILKQQYRMGSDGVVLNSENLRYLFRDDLFIGMENPDRRQGLILLFSLS